jgi:hypothetical protein
MQAVLSLCVPGLVLRRNWRIGDLLGGDAQHPQTVLALEPNTDADATTAGVGKGYRFAGTAVVVERGNAAFDALIGRFQSPLEQRMRAIVTITVTKAQPLTSPAYDDGTSEPATRPTTRCCYRIVCHSSSCFRGRRTAYPRLVGCDRVGNDQGDNTAKLVLSHQASVETVSSFANPPVGSVLGRGRAPGEPPSQLCGYPNGDQNQLTTRPAAPNISAVATASWYSPGPLTAASKNSHRLTPANRNIANTRRIFRRPCTVSCHQVGVLLDQASC